MTDEDILKMARKIASNQMAENYPSVSKSIFVGEWDGHNSVQVALAAIKAGMKAERERCAKVAINFGINRPLISAGRPNDIVRGRYEGEQAASSAIAAAIKGGE